MVAASDGLAGSGLWSLLQISDRLFPTGGYAFSHALETYVELGLVHDRESCQQLLVNVCYHALGPWTWYSVSMLSAWQPGRV